MAPGFELDEELNNKVLAYVSEPKACLSCHAWKDYLYDALQLGHRIRFHQALHDKGTIDFSYNAVRPLGEDFEESVGYSFVFSPGGTYHMQWTRTFDAWSSQSEQHFGHWCVFMDSVVCETLDKEDKSDKQVHYAPAGYKFKVPIDEILSANGVYFQAALGSPAAPWELPARTGKADESTQAFWTEGMWRWPHEQNRPASPPLVRQDIALRPDTRFVEVEGEVHEVSGDIVANWPEADWARLMKCRLQFGIRG